MRRMIETIEMDEYENSRRTITEKVFSNTDFTSTSKIIERMIKDTS
mgnify:CR=1 FL=1